MEAIILAGGFGTRLNHIVSDVPKAMAPVNNKPFLVYLLDYLHDHQIKKVVLAVGYKSDHIKNYFKNSYKGLKIIYSDEDSPLGTGGAIKKALSKCKTENIFIFNGDTYFDVDLLAMKKCHHQTKCQITIAIKEMVDYDRYGSVVINNNKIIRFIEKKKTKKGMINGGVYLLNKNALQTVPAEQFSFEKVILESLDYPLCAFQSDGYFIDIGVADDYEKAQSDFSHEK